MKKNIIISICVLMVFVLLFYVSQLFVMPIFPGESTEMVRGYQLLEDNTLDVVFLGASQTFTGIDSGRLTSEYGIESYNLCASGQIMSMTPLYFDYALKTQTPKVVMVEVYSAFSKPTGYYDASLAWNYAPMPASSEKYQSLLKIFGGDALKAIEYCYFPLFAYHGRWSSVNVVEYYRYNVNPQNCLDISSRGFVGRNHIEPVTIEYLKYNTVQREIPQSNQDDMLYMANVCKERGMKIVFYKSPAADWSKGDSLAVKSFMTTNNLTFIDLNDYLDEIGIDANTDFHSVNHLNTSGAEKTTEYIADYLKDLL